MSQAPTPPSTTSTPSTHLDVIILRNPSSYGGEVSRAELNKENVDPGEVHTIFEAPTIEWMEKTWTVTHSTLHMWRNCKNVKITYQALGDGKMSDLVENIVVKRTWFKPQPTRITGIDVPDSKGPGSWKWGGSDFLTKFVTVRWEVLGWGERKGKDGGDGEKWMVTWFEKSIFQEEGFDIYSDRMGGISEGLYKDIVAALSALQHKPSANLVKEEMRAVEINY